MIVKNDRRTVAGIDTERLYHYTSIDALHGIVTSACLWASSIHYLNDSSEVLLGMRLLRENIEADERACGHDDMTPFREALLEWLEKYEALNDHVFVASFSSARDRLSQWRGYSRFGQSACLVFDRRTLKQLVELNGWTEHRCRYAEDDHKSSASFLKNSFFHDLRAEISAMRRREDFFRKFDESRNRIFELSERFKNSAFEEEQEVRLVSPMSGADHECVKFRKRNNMLVPFREFNLKRSESDTIKFDEIIVGPTPEIELSIKSIEAFLKKNRIELRNGVSPSAIPFREL